MSSVIEEWERSGGYLEAAGHRVFAVDRPAGTGVDTDEAVLVLHGFPTSGYDWHRSLDVLGARRRVVIPDYPGFGLSAKPDQRYSLFEHADAVVSVAEQLGVRNAVLVTHDLGDSVGGEVLARSLDGTLPFEVTQRVITNGSVYMDLVQLSVGQQLLLSLPDERLPEGAGPDRDALVGALAGTLAPDADVPAGELEAHADLIVRDGGNRVLPRTIRYIEERRVHEGRWTGAIERHPAPLTIVWGDLDPIAVWPMAERLHERRPDATLVRLDGIGHYPMVESPERFNAALEHALG